MFIGVGYRPSTREEAEDALLFWELKRKSLEALICKTDPNDDEGDFGDLVTDVLDARDEIGRLRGIVAQYRSNSYQEAKNGVD